MIIHINTDDLDIQEWNDLSLKEKDELVNSLINVEHKYMFKTRRILTKPDNSLDKDINEILTHVGEICLTHTYIGIFKGIEETWEDYYYIVELKNGKIIYNTMVDKIEFNNN